MRFRRPAQSTLPALPHFLHHLPAPRAPTSLFLPSSTRAAALRHSPPAPRLLTCYASRDDFWLVVLPHFLACLPATVSTFTTCLRLTTGDTGRAPRTSAPLPRTLIPLPLLYCGSAAPLHLYALLRARLRRAGSFLLRYCDTSDRCRRRLRLRRENASVYNIVHLYLAKLSPALWRRASRLARYLSRVYFLLMPTSHALLPAASLHRSHILIFASYAIAIFL